MTTKTIIIIIAYLEFAHCTYQPYNFVQSTPVATSMYAPHLSPTAYPSMYASQPMVSPYSIAPSYAPTAPAYAPFAPMPPVAPPVYSTPTYTPPVNPTPTYPTPTPFALIPAIPAIPTYPPMVSSKSPTTSKTQIGLSTPKCTPPTATAYYITATEPPKAVIIEKVKENLKELPAPTYPCPFCTGFANVPKNSKVPPPPPCSAVLPGILDKIPTIALPDELKIKKLDKLAKPCPLLADLFEHKLSGKLRFDEDLLDGFLTGLGLGK